MVDDNEFIKRRHLSRGRPRKYEPSSSPISNNSECAIPTNKESCDNCYQSCNNLVSDPEHKIEITDTVEISTKNNSSFF
ncbi:GH17224 [Drosophila grimshawi]|uniref:GH17224 n=1 Tax=Drosophila grimshawi TaxID=7222 RepID=B4JHS4_DROGR|nr:GH17224 [Drosophila grimshawi]